jgi:DNA replication and repair protein RecF
VVLISPSDIDLVKDSSEERRKFFDSMISQLDHAYLMALAEYNHCLKQRNSLLHMFQDRGSVDTDLLESYDHRLVKSGTVLHAKRTEFIEEFLPFVNGSFNTLTDSKEEVKMTYRSPLAEIDFLEGLKKSFQKDLALQRTTFGVHRDDFTFEFAHGELKKLGSQGQQKSFLVALKLANFEIIKRHKGYSPILLLDDIFDKLDDHRIARLLSIVTAEGYGQLFITDAGPERTEQLLRTLNIQAGLYQVKDGQITAYDQKT